MILYITMRSRIRQFFLKLDFALGKTGPFQYVALPTSKVINNLKSLWLMFSYNSFSPLSQ